MKTINDELRLKDIERLTRIIEERAKSRVQQDKAKKVETEILQSVLEHLNSGKWITQGNQNLCFFFIIESCCMNYRR